MAKMAFCDSADSLRLKAWGYVATNQPGETAIPVADDFLLEPRDGWRYDGVGWVAFPFPIVKSALRLAIEDALNGLPVDTPVPPAKLRAVFAEWLKNLS